MCAAREHVMLAVVEFCHGPHGRIDADKAVVERRVENRRQLLDQRIGFCDGGAFRGIVPDRAGMLCLVGAAEAVVEIDDAARPGDDAVPHCRLDFCRLNGPRPLRRRSVNGQPTSTKAQIG